MDWVFWCFGIVGGFDLYCGEEDDSDAVVDCCLINGLLVVVINRSLLRSFDFGWVLKFY
ncbi:hypothetical protein D3C72_2432050 [compost metagenome]